MAHSLAWLAIDFESIATLPAPQRLTEALAVPVSSTEYLDGRVANRLSDSLEVGEVVAMFRHYWPDVP